jgi:hypothetical protein
MITWTLVKNFQEDLAAAPEREFMASPKLGLVACRARRTTNVALNEIFRANHNSTSS